MLYYCFMLILQGITAGLLVSIVALLVFYGMAVRHVEQEARQTIRAFLVSPDDKTPSPLAQSVVSMAQIIAPLLAQSLTASLMGKASGMSKALAGAEADLAGEALAAANPQVAMLAGLFPGLQKRFAKSPMLAMALSQLDLGKMFGGKGNGSKGNTAPAKFKFGQ